MKLKNIIGLVICLLSVLISGYSLYFVDQAKQQLDQKADLLVGIENISIAEECDTYVRYCITYTDGTKWYYNVRDGKDGYNGIDGKDGIDGTSIVATNIDNDGNLILKYSNGISYNLGCIVGQDGKDGVNGKDGADGKDGKGIKSFYVNSNGYLVANYEDGSFQTITAQNISSVVKTDMVDKTELQGLVNNYQITWDGCSYCLYMTTEYFSKTTLNCLFSTNTLQLSYGTVSSGSSSFISGSLRPKQGVIISHIKMVSAQQRGISDVQTPDGTLGITYNYNLETCSTIFKYNNYWNITTSEPLDITVSKAQSIMIYFTIAN